MVSKNIFLKHKCDGIKISAHFNIWWTVSEDAASQLADTTRLFVKDFEGRQIPFLMQAIL